MTRAANSLLSLAYFTLLSGQMHSYATIAAWLGETEFRVLSPKGLLKAPGTSMISAVRQK